MEDKLKVGLIDDEESALKTLSEIVDQFTDFELGFATVDPFEGLLKVEKGEVDILITDVMIPKMGGLEISERLRNSGVPIIFCSAYDKYAVDGFQQDAVHYVMKPVYFKEVSIALNRAKDRLLKTKIIGASGVEDFRIVNSNGGMTGELIKIAYIDYLEQSGNYTYIHLGKDTKVITSSLSGALEKIGGSVILRIHKSFAVNINKIRKIQFTEIELYNGQKISLGKIYKDNLARLVNNKKL